MTSNPHALLQKDKVQPEELPKLSPSSINLYAQDPALWVLKHFYNSTSGFNIHAMRGVAIEDGLNLYLKLCESASPRDVLTSEGIDLPEGVLNPYKQGLRHAGNRFDDLAFYWGDEDLLQKIEQEIGPWFEKCVEAMAYSIMVASKGEYPRMQDQIITEIEGVPVGGYLDYSFDEMQIDLKTATKVPKAVTRGGRKGFLPADKKANVRQQAIYQYSNNKATALLYVSPEDFYLHELHEEELAEALEDVRELVKKMKKLLTSPIEDVIKNSVPNWKAMNYSFYWDENLRRMADTIWEGFKPEEDGGY